MLCNKGEAAYIPFACGHVPSNKTKLNGPSDWSNCSIEIESLLGYSNNVFFAFKMDSRLTSPSTCLDCGNLLPLSDERMGKILKNMACESKK